MTRHFLLNGLNVGRKIINYLLHKIRNRNYVKNYFSMKNQIKNGSGFYSSFSSLIIQ